MKTETREIEIEYDSLNNGKLYVTATAIGWTYQGRCSGPPETCEPPDSDVNIEIIKAWKDGKEFAIEQLSEKEESEIYDMIAEKSFVLFE